jgi:hypothetical protein
MNWKWCVLPSLAMVLLSLIPQIHLWIVRGSDWNGAYVSPQGDELLYSAYLNALINERTRKNDPFGGTDNSTNSPLPESIFSLQSVPAYAVALPARALGVSASMAFVVLIGVAALLTSLSLFWLIKNITHDLRLASAGTLVVLCLGCIVGRYGFFGTFLDIGVAAFPFLRRYQPAVAFPLFFVFQLLIWSALTSEDKRRARVYAIVAGLTLVVLVYSHLYLWTASAAWMACIGGLWLCFQPSKRWETAVILTTVGVITAIALGPYVYLISHRAATLDQQQILISTHRPDPWRLHELLGVAILVALVIGILRRRIERTDPRLLYAASLALLPFVVFNQQVVTGRTMQVFHFEVAVVNYSTLVGLLITSTLLWQPVPRRLLIWIGSLSLVWAFFLVALPARLVFVPQAIVNDQMVPVLRRLNDLSAQDGTLADLRTKGQASSTVFSPSVALIALLPTWTSQGTLLDMTGVDCRSMTREERKERVHMHLYYSNVDIEALRQALNGIPDRNHEELSSVRTAIFGYERTSAALTPEFKPIQEDEIDAEVQAYQTYVNLFSSGEALSHPLTYVVVRAEGNFNFTNIDRWYDRDAGERVGPYALYRLKLRS